MVILPYPTSMARVAPSVYANATITPEVDDVKIT